MYGIENLKAVLSFIVETTVKIEYIHQDGRGTWIEWLGILPSPFFIPQLFEAVKQTPKELNDLDPAEYRELVAFIKAKFDLNDDKAEHLAEHAFNLLASAVLHGGSIVKLLRK